MKRMIRLIVAVIILCTPLFSQTPLVDTTTIRGAILKVMEDQREGWNKGSIEQFMQGYAQSDSLRFGSGGSVTYGWNEMLERYKKRYSTKEQMGTLIFGGVTVSVLSNDAAMVFGRWELQRAKDVPRGLFTLLFRKIGGKWQIVHDHTSTGE